MAYKKNVVEAKLTELEAIYDDSTENFPETGGTEGSAEACRDYTRSARPGLIMVDRMRALSKGSANNR